MKAYVMIALCLLAGLIAIPLTAETPKKVLDINPRILRDYSAENSVLVVISLEDRHNLTGKKSGPERFTFCKVSPLIGQRFTPVRGTNAKNPDSEHVFFFDGVKPGEAYKVYDFYYTEWDLLLGTMYYRAVMGLSGDDGLVRIEKPDIYFMGAFQPNPEFYYYSSTSETSALKPAPGTKELAVLQALLDNLKDYPGWSALVEQRIKELEK